MFRKKSSRSSSAYGWYDKPQKPAIAAGTGIRGGGKYGSTWWGQQWLQAFNNISDSNRLPRGRTYANNGSVRDITISGNTVRATVQGSRLYQIDIRIPQFSPAEREKITALLAERPDLLSQLLNRALPAEVHDACAEHGVHIFPRRWNDLQASCSCPDYAMPCKHLAAIIYLIANEIDKNPFQVFDLHGFDLPQALQDAGFAAADTRCSAAAPLLASLWQEKPQPAAAAAPFTFDPALLDALDFSQLPDCREHLAAILPDKPVFYPSGDFKAVLKKAWASIAKQTAKAVPELPGVFQNFDFQSVEKVSLALDDWGAPLRLSAWADGGDRLLFESDDMSEWKNWLSAVPPGRLAQVPDPVRALWLSWRFADALAKQGALVPQLLDAGGDYWTVRWLPALLNEQVADTFARYAALLRPGFGGQALQPPGFGGQALQPPGLLHYEVEGKNLPPAPSDYPLALLSVFLGHTVRSCCPPEPGAAQSLAHQLFFEGLPTTFDRFENKAHPTAIGLWLNRFFIAEKNVVPVLEVAEMKEGFELSLLVEDKTASMMAPVPLAEVFESPRFAPLRLEFLRDLSNLGEHFPALRQLLADKGKKPLRYAASDFAAVLLQTLPIIRLFGIRVLLPKSLSRILRPQLSLSLRSGPDGRVLSGSSITLKNMLAYQWQVALGERHLSAEEFLALVRDSAGLVKIRGEYVYLDPKETQALADKLAKPPVLSSPELFQIALSEEYAGAGIQLTEELRGMIRQLLEAEPLPLPAGLQATLRPYQQRGYDWLCKNARLGFGSILADDMGLGKTLQVIAALLRLKEEGSLNDTRRALVVAPTTLLTNWQREAARFAPGLTTAVYHGAARSLDEARLADVVLTSYGAVRSDAAKLERHAWAALVIDEAQNIKNPGAEQSKAVKKIPADVRIAMSGTPVENRLSEYWSVLDFANKGYLGGLPHFKSQFAIPIEGERDQRATRRFRRATQPFVLRRLKTDKSIISDLPDKVEQNQFCQLTPEQAALYQSEVDAAMSKIENSEGIARRGQVLNLIMSLKQICNHPAQYLKKGRPDPDLSGKCPMLLDLVGEALENDEKVLIFTQFREMGELLAAMLEERTGQPAPFLHGGLSRPARDRMVEDFQTKPAHRVLLLSLKAGGTGLNLTAASQVIHFDLWWNPAVEAQATDRAFRIGQRRNVQVHRFITAATFEEKINAMIQKKKELADLTVASGETWVGDLSDKELRGLFRLGGE